MRMLTGRRGVAVRAAAIGLLLAAAGTAAPRAAAQSTVSPAQVAAIGSPGSGHAQLYGWGAATLKDGSVIIGDYWNQRIVHYDANGNYLGVLITLASVPTVYSAPYGLAVDTSGGPNDGDIYVGFECCAVERFFMTPKGTYVRAATRLTATGMRYPSRVAVDRHGTVYVSDMLANTIFVYDQNAITAGRPSDQWGSLGSGWGQFNQPRAIALDSSQPSQHLYVVDANNHRVDVIDTSNGQFINSFSTGPGGNIRGLAIDTNAGIVYVIDDTSGTIHRYNLDGTQSSGDTDIGGPWASDGRSCCAPVGLFANGGREATVDGDGNLWVGDMPDFRVQVWHPSTRSWQVFPTPCGCPPNGGFNSPHGVAVAPSGNLIVSDTYNFRTQGFGADGSWQWSQGIRGVAKYALDYPMGVAIEGDGSFLVVDSYNNALKKFSSNGTWMWTYTAKGGQGLDRPEGIALGPGGSIYVADLLHKRIDVLQDNGNAVATWVRTISCSCLTHPSGVAIDPNTQDIFVADLADVVEFNSAGTELATIGGSGSSSPLKAPFDVVLDGTNLYVSDTKGNDVKVYAEADGSFQEQFGTQGSGTGQFFQPLGLALNGNGDLYVADSGNDRVTEWCLQC